MCVCDKLSGYTSHFEPTTHTTKTIFGKHVDIHADGSLSFTILVYVQMGLFKNSEKNTIHTNWQNDQNSLVIASNIIVCNGNFHTNWPLFWEHTHQHQLYSLFALFWSKPTLFYSPRKISVFTYRFTLSMSREKEANSENVYLGYDRICKSYAYFSTIRQMTRYFCLVTYGPFLFSGLRMPGRMTKSFTTYIIYMCVCVCVVLV